MAFPLVVNARSAAVEPIDLPTPISVLEITATRVARFLLFTNQRSAAVEVMGTTPPTVSTPPTQGQFIPPIVEPF